MPCPGYVLFLLPKVSFCCLFTQKADSSYKTCQLKEPSRGKPSLIPLREASDPHFSGLPHSGASYLRVQNPLNIVSQYLGTFVQALFSGHMPVVFFFFFTIFSKEYKTRIDVWLGTQAVKSDEPRFTSQLPLTSCVALEKLLYHPVPHSSPL